MERQIRQRDLEMVSRCGKMELSLYREGGYYMVEGVDILNIWGKPYAKQMMIGQRYGATS